MDRPVSGGESRKMQPTLSQPGKFSFNEIRALVYAQPSPRDRLPAYDGASFWETLLALFLSIVSDRIARSMKRTLADSGDLKDDQPKLFHPKGVCAEARWEVYAESGYTGLFAPGAVVPALVRMSASGNNTAFKSGFLSIPLLRQPRSFGLAVKLFPAPDPNQKVPTCNLLLFDQTGVDGNPSPWYMRGARQENGTFAEQYFLNWMHGSGLITTGFARLFSRFATDVRHRSLNSLANVDAANRPVPIPKCPPFLRLVPVARYP